jgi:hypothetical protein
MWFDHFFHLKWENFSLLIRNNEWLTYQMWLPGSKLILTKFQGLVAPFRMFFTSNNFLLLSTITITQWGFANLLAKTWCWSAYFGFTLFLYSWQTAVATVRLCVINNSYSLVTTSHFLYIQSPTATQHYKTLRLKQKSCKKPCWFDT